MAEAMQDTAVSLRDTQQAFEEEAIGLGIERYRKELAAHGQQDLPPGLVLMKRTIEPMSAAVKKYVEDAQAGKASRAAGTSNFLVQFGNQYETIALVVLQSAIRHMAIEATLQACALDVAKRLEEVLNHDHLKAENAQLYRKWKLATEKNKQQGSRYVMLKKQMKFAGLLLTKWGIAEKVRLGTTLLDIMINATGMAMIQKASRGKADTPQFIVPTPETREWLDKANGRCELLSPMYMPMVIKPTPWSTIYGGGYLDSRLRYPLIKRPNKEYLEEMKHVNMPDVYEAVNAIQDTGWAVNKPVYAVMQAVWQGGGILGKLPAADLLPMPTKDFTDEDADNKTEVYKLWARRAAQVHQDNRKMVSKRTALVFKMSLAEKLRDFEAFYFPQALDWRGRCYAMGSHLNPQGDDVAKGLLQFSEGKPLGVNGAYWLAVHGANCFGVDKVTFEARVQWVADNQDAILESAVNPLDGSRFWDQADNPWQFLAFCKEWAGYTMQGDTYVSNLAVGLDGACNGLQNFSAMLRDEVGGAAVGLVPGAKPSDVYSDVARASQAIIDQDVLDNPVGTLEGDTARRWVGKITRKLTKRNTMTTPYGVSAFGMRDQLYEEYRKDAQEAALRGNKLDYEMTHSDAAYLAKTNHIAIGMVVIAARAAMDWLQAVARVAAKDGLPIQWTTPCGYRAVQRYTTTVGKRLDFDVAEKRYRLMIQIDGTELDGRRQALGIAPNFVHSLDASHLVKTVVKARTFGIGSFAMVHDSFGTHAADIDSMAFSLRRAFVEQYTPDVLGNFLEEIKAQLPDELAEKLPPLPEKGRLDLEAVMNSEYFFA